MSEDFFETLSVAVAKQRSAADAIQQSKDDNWQFAMTVFTRLQRTAKLYLDKCLGLGLLGSVDIAALKITFQLYYHSGHNSTFSLVSNEGNDFRLVFEWETTTGSPHPRKATSADEYHAENWEDKLYTDRLEEFISDFVNRADEFGGLPK